MSECFIPFSGHFDIDLISKIIVSSSIYPILFKVESKIWLLNSS